MGRHAEAERCLCQAIAELEALPRLSRQEKTPAWWADRAEDLQWAVDSLVAVLHDQGKKAAARELTERRGLPFLVRRILGPAASEAAVKAFDVQGGRGRGGSGGI